MNEATRSVERWLSNLLNAPPSAPDLAVYVCKQAGVGEWAWNRSARDAVLKLANMTLQLDTKMREQNRIALELVDRLAAAKHALSDCSHTNIVALERLEEQDVIVKAAIAWEKAGRAGPGSDFLAAATALRAVVQKHNSIVESRS